MSLSVVTAAAERGRPVLDGKCRRSPRLDTGYFAGQVIRLCGLRLAPCIESQDWPSGPASDHLLSDESLRKALLFSRSSGEPVLPRTSRNTKPQPLCADKRSASAVLGLGELPQCRHCPHVAGPQSASPSYPLVTNGDRRCQENLVTGAPPFVWCRFNFLPASYARPVSVTPQLWRPPCSMLNVHANRGVRRYL